MATVGTLQVVNSSDHEISGFVSHKNRKSSTVYFDKLAVGASTNSVQFNSGWDTRDEWYMDVTFEPSVGFAKAHYRGPTACAFYAKDESAGGAVQIVFKNDHIEIVCPKSGSCTPKLSDLGSGIFAWPDPS